MNLTRVKLIAIQVAKFAGNFIRRKLGSAKRIDSATRYDIKLELDVRCQKLIERKLRAIYPDVDFLGEEDEVRKTDAAYRWVVDPIDGTVNFAYGIPHACVAIALQGRSEVLTKSQRSGPRLH